MNQITLLGLAILGGVFLALQGSLNAQLGMLLKNSFLATLIAFSFSALFALGIFFLINKQTPSSEQIRSIPYYLWFLGGMFSVLGISLYYFTIPKLGVSTMITFGLFGQLSFAFIAGHYGWFGFPKEPINTVKLMGILALSLGVVLINYK